MNGREGGGVWILLFSEVTLFEYNVSTILSPIVACFLVLNGKKRRTRMKGSSLNSCLHLLSSYLARPRAFPVENETEPPVPFVNGKASGTRLSSHTIMGQSGSAGGCSKITKVGATKVFILWKECWLTSVIFKSVR